MDEVSSSFYINQPSAICIPSVYWIKFLIWNIIKRVGCDVGRGLVWCLHFTIHQSGDKLKIDHSYVENSDSAFYKMFLFQNPIIYSIFSIISLFNNCCGLFLRFFLLIWLIQGLLKKDIRFPISSREASYFQTAGTQERSSPIANKIDPW